MRFAPFNEPFNLRSLQELFNISVGGDIEKGKVSNIKTDIFCYPIIGNALTNGGLYGYTDSWKQNNSITVTGRGEIGIAVERPYKYYPIVRLLTLKPKVKLDLKYFECLINSHRILNESTGVPQLTTPQIGKQKYLIVAYEEQRVIGNLFRKIDERIVTQNKIIEEYQTLKNCIIDAIILKSRKIETCKINKIIEEYSVKTTINNEYPVLSSTASGIYFQNEYFNKEAASENTTGYKCVPNGYCTYRSMSDTGRFYFNMQNITDVGIVSPAYPVFSVKEDSALFLVSVLNRDKNVIKEILKLKAGGTRFSLPFKKLVELEIPWPDHQTRKHFMKIIRNMIQKIDLEQKILAKYIDQKNYLLNNMFI